MVDVNGILGKYLNMDGSSLFTMNLIKIIVIALNAEAQFPYNQHSLLKLIICVGSHFPTLYVA